MARRHVRTKPRRWPWVLFALAVVALSVVLYVAVDQLLKVNVEYKAADDLYTAIELDFGPAQTSAPEESLLAAWNAAIPLSRIPFGEEAIRFVERAKSFDETFPEDVVPVPTAMPQAVATLPPMMPAAVDFDGLRAVNAETVGWIYIPHTRINYPILQAHNNTKYLRRGFDGAWLTSGSIFLDYMADPSLRGGHAIIYGHFMKNGGMFYDLLQFKKQAYYNAHPGAYLFTPDEIVRLAVVGVFPAQASEKLRTVLFQNEREYREYVRWMLGQSIFPAKVQAEDVTRLFTLVTCSYEWEDTRTFLLLVPWAEAYPEAAENR